MLPGFGEVLLSIVLSLVVCSVISGFVYLLISRHFASMPARSASALSFFYGVIPVLASITVPVMLLKPHWAELLFHEHCHGEVCGPHVPDVSNTIAGVAFAVLATLMVAVVTFYIGRQAWRNRGRQSTLRTLANEVSYDHWSRFPGSAPVAFTGGLLRPHIFVSDTMIELLSGAELQLLLLHEQSHMRHRDPLRRFILNWSTRLWPRKLRQQFLSDHALFCEQRADYEAAKSTGREYELISMLGRLSEQCGVTQCDYVEQRCSALTGNSSEEWSKGLLPMLSMPVVFVSELSLMTYLIHPVIDLILVIES